MGGVRGGSPRGVRVLAWRRGLSFPNQIPEEVVFSWTAFSGAFYLETTQCQSYIVKAFDDLMQTNNLQHFTQSHRRVK